MLARANEDGLALDGNVLHPALRKAEKGDALAVDREVDVFESGAAPEEGLDREDVLAVRREVVADDDPAARPVGCVLDVIPRMLRHLDRVRVFGGGRERVAVSDG